MSKRQELTCEFSQANGTFNLNDDINGKIIVQPLTHISFHKVIFEIYWSISNDSKSEEKLVKKQAYNTQRKDWEAGKRYELNFSFKSQAPLSFSSKQFKIERYLKVRVIRREGAWSFGKNDPDYQFSYNFHYTLNSNLGSYQLNKTSLDVNYNDFLAYLLLPIGAGLLGGLNGLLFMDLLGAGVLVGGLYHTFVGFGKLGKVNVMVFPLDDTHFQVQMNVQRNWSSIEKIELVHLVYYLSGHLRRDVTEEKRMPIKKLLYQDYDTINSNNINIVRSYHSINLPPTLKTKYFDINWELEIIIHLKNRQMKGIKLETTMDILAR